MKKTYPKNVRRVHSEHLNNSFLTTILLLVLLCITAFALTGCYNDMKNPNVQTASAKMKLSTGNRFTGPDVSR